MPRQLTDLPADVTDALLHGQGLLTADTARRFGISAARVHRLYASGLLVRVAKGVYGSAFALHVATAWDALALRSRAFVLASGPGVCASGWSAAALHRLPTISDPPLLPQALGHVHNSPYGRTRSANLPNEHRTIVDGIPVTTVGRTLVDLARTSPRDEALVVADAALAGGLSMASIQDVLSMQRGWEGIDAARWVVQHADPYAETALETLGRLTFIEGGLPVPISNAWIDLGAVRFRPDHLLDELWEIFEGDGAWKYNDRPDAGSVIAKQREREWHLREAGYEIGLRYGYREARYERPVLARRFQAAIATRQPRRRRAAWYRDPIAYRAA